MIYNVKFSVNGTPREVSIAAFSGTSVSDLIRCVQRIDHYTNATNFAVEIDHTFDDYCADREDFQADC